MNQNQKTALIVGGVIVGVLIIISVVLSGVFWGWQGDGYGMMGPSMMGGFGGMFFIPIVGIVVLGLIIWVVVAGSHRSGEADSSAYREDSPVEILKRRYARGELDKEEFEAKKKDLV